MIHTGDCVEVMRGMEAESVDAIVTDPPYGLEFMGKEWDRLGDIGKTSHAGPREHNSATVFSRQRVAYSGSSNRKCGTCRKWEWDYPERKCTCEVPDFPNVHAHQSKIMGEWHEAWAREALRVAKPGAHLLAFGGTRTYHRLASAIEDAGWEIRDCLVWAYASGFPKSLDVSKAIDKAAGEEREVVGYNDVARRNRPEKLAERADDPLARMAGKGKINDRETAAAITAPATPDAAKWDGWGTALKPAWEPIVLARKPLRGSVAANVLRYGTGGLNIDATRIGNIVETWPANRSYGPGQMQPLGIGRTQMTGAAPAGRWPANLILTDPIFDGGVEGVVGGGAQDSGDAHQLNRGGLGYGSTADGDVDAVNGGSGTYSRFFLIPKAARSDREPVLRGTLPPGGTGLYDDDGYRAEGQRKSDHTARGKRENLHPTVKPVDLMRHLVRLVTPPGGTVLDCFLGSGTTAIAAELEGFAWIGIEKEPEYVAIAEARLNGTQRGMGL